MNQFRSSKSDATPKTVAAARPTFATPKPATSASRAPTQPTPDRATTNRRPDKGPFRAARAKPATRRPPAKSPRWHTTARALAGWRRSPAARGQRPRRSRYTRCRTTAGPELRWGALPAFRHSDTPGLAPPWPPAAQPRSKQPPGVGREPRGLSHRPHTPGKPKPRRPDHRVGQSRTSSPAPC